MARFWRIAGIERSPAELEAKLDGGERALGALDRALEAAPFLVEERYTIADIALYGYTHVAEEGGFALEPYPALRAWHDRVAAQPGHVPITA